MARQQQRQRGGSSRQQRRRRRRSGAGAGTDAQAADALSLLGWLLLLGRAAAVARQGVQVRARRCCQPVTAAHPPVCFPAWPHSHPHVLPSSHLPLPRRYNGAHFEGRSTLNKEKLKQQCERRAVAFPDLTSPPPLPAALLERRQAAAAAAAAAVAAEAAAVEAAGEGSREAHAALLAAAGGGGGGAPPLQQ